MSKTFEINEVTGEHFPSKSRRKVRQRKYFGHAYPCEVRPKSVLIAKIDKEIFTELLLIKNI